MSRYPACHGAGGAAFQHHSERREERKAARDKRNNADIRPWIQASEAAELVLSKIKIAEPID